MYYLLLCCLHADTHTMNKTNQVIMAGRLQALYEPSEANTAFRYWCSSRAEYCVRLAWLVKSQLYRLGSLFQQIIHF